MVEIRPIQHYQIEQVKQLITTVCLELWQDVLTEQDLNRYDSMVDIEHVQANYFENDG